MTMNVTGMTEQQVVEAFAQWDEDEEFSKARRRCSKAQLCADFLCIGYSLYSPDLLPWADATAAQVLAFANADLVGKEELDRRIAQGLTLEEILDGIESCRLLNLEASQWVQRILAAYAASYDPREVGCSGGDALEFLERVTYEIPELMRKRMESPLLFGQMCLELERYLVFVQSGSATD
jgi:hypothetical protein